MTKLIVDGTEIDVPPEYTLLQACEAAGAATAAALLAGKVDLEPGNTVVAVVSGGNVAAQTAAAILAEQ